MKIKAVLINDDGSTTYKEFARKSEKSARSVYYDMSVWYKTLSVALCDDEGNILAQKNRK